MKNFIKCSLIAFSISFFIVGCTSNQNGKQNSQEETSGNGSGDTTDAFDNTVPIH